MKGCLEHSNRNELAHEMVPSANADGDAAAQRPYLAKKLPTIQTPVRLQ
jgi:hypothetical protein